MKKANGLLAMIPIEIRKITTADSRNGMNVAEALSFAAQEGSYDHRKPDITLAKIKET